MGTLAEKNCDEAKTDQCNCYACHNEWQRCVWIGTGAEYTLLIHCQARHSPSITLDIRDVQDIQTTSSVFPFYLTFVSPHHPFTIPHNVCAAKAGTRGEPCVAGSWPTGRLRARLRGTFGDFCAYQRETVRASLSPRILDF